MGEHELKDERFLKAVERVLAHEGVYVNDSADPGGETRWGISKRAYPDLDILSLTREQAIEIYYRDWWQKYGYDRITDDEIASKLLDLAVNVGHKQAHMFVQRAVKQSGGEWLDVDGVLGDLSISAINRHPCPEHLLIALKLQAIRYYVDLSKPRFLAGWVRRAIA